MLVFQLTLGGLMIMFMDEVISKWGFGSGISLFIAAGVSQHLFIRLLSPLREERAASAFVGVLPDLFRALADGDVATALLHISSIAATALIFAVVVYTQAMKVEIPLSFGRVRGHGVRWPLNFFYTSNIPVILVAALIANVQLFARLLQGWLGHGTFLGEFSDSGTPIGGLAALLFNPNLLRNIIVGGVSNVSATLFFQAILYVFLFAAGSVLFSWFWVQTSGLDARSQAKQMLASGLQIPGFRKDPRVLERMLERYITPLTVMGGLAVGLLAASADLLGALTSGTGLLLTIMIVYRLYEEVAQQHVMDMNPMLRKFMGK
ncbi:hypothetical protein D6783_03045 [Candidatus Woesearchaeota archaeon]|nr:MAG: hypothetical protein D6783_03045 [Candidatus Woesearchaeota archaeon]